MSVSFLCPLLSVGCKQMLLTILVPCSAGFDAKKLNPNSRSDLTLIKTEVFPILSTKDKNWIKYLCCEVQSYINYELFFSRDTTFIYNMFALLAIPQICNIDA